MFNAKPKIILQLKRDALFAYISKDEPAKLDFPPSVVRNLELLDAKKFEEIVAEFAVSCGLKGKKIVILLDESVVFQKVSSLDAGSDQMAMKKDFQSKIPLEAKVQRVLAVKLKEQLMMLGTNGEVYNHVVNALDGKGAKVTAVMPLVVFVKGAERLTPEVVEHVIANHQLAEAANFLNLEHK